MKRYIFVAIIILIIKFGSNNNIVESVNAAQQITNPSSPDVQVKIIQKIEFAFPSPEAKIITSEYGTRINPVTKKKSFHYGIDLSSYSNCKNTPIVSIYKGIIIEKYWSDEVGNVIKIKHEINGQTWYSRYLHMNKIIVKKGQEVEKGQQIGMLGSTGSLSTGSHLHFEIYLNGKIVNPKPYLF